MITLFNLISTFIAFISTYCFKVTHRPQKKLMACIDKVLLSHEAWGDCVCFVLH